MFLQGVSINATSRKTRIETSYLNPEAKSLRRVLTPLPEKQGLKLVLSLIERIIIIVLTPLPEKQGLKR